MLIDSILMSGSSSGCWNILFAIIPEVRYVIKVTIVAMIRLILSPASIMVLVSWFFPRCLCSAVNVMIALVTPLAINISAIEMGICAIERMPKLVGPSILAIMMVPIADIRVEVI